MSTEEIKKKLKEEKDAIFTKEVEYNKSKYYMAFKLVKDGMQYYYYEIKDNKFQEVNNFKTIEYLRNFNEINEDFIY